MYCQNCGRQIPDGTVCPCSSGAPLLSSNPVLNALKTIGSSPLFLVTAIFFSLSCALSLLGQLLPNQEAMEAADFLYTNFGIEISQLAPVTSPSAVSTVISAIISVVPAVLTAIGLWMHYVTCRGRKSGGISTAGLTICKVLSILGAVFLGLSCFLGIVVSVLGVVWAGYFSNSFYSDYGPSLDGDVTTILIAIFVVCAVVFAVVLALVICYTVSLVRVINRVKATAASGMPDNRISQFLVAMNYILAVCYVFGGIFSFCSVSWMGAGVVAAGFNSLIDAACYVTASLCLTRYRREMTALLYPPVQPVYPGQPGMGYQPGDPWSSR